VNYKDWDEAGRAGVSAREAADKAWTSKKSKPDHPALTLEEWLERDLPELDCLLGDLLTTTCRVLIVGPTGLGKTMFGLAVAMAIVSNSGFLHWIARRSGRVLYIDGEMSNRQMKVRLRDAVRRAGIKREHSELLTMLSREDFDDMPPLNTKDGQEWLDSFIGEYGTFDLIIFDNIQALLSGSMKDDGRTCCPTCAHSPAAPSARYGSITLATMRPRATARRPASGRWTP
jgi:RecA-family ATPase